MRIVCTGGRDFKEWALVTHLLETLKPKDIFVGDCPTGLDLLVRQWGTSTGCKLKIFYADWNLHGKAAGPIRNREMLEAAGDALVFAFKGGRGTADCVRQAIAMKFTVLQVQP